MTQIYNQLVDIYEYYKKQLDSKEKDEEALIKKETIFLQKIEEMTSKPLIMEMIGANIKYASLYNDLVDLYNHYKRRQEISNELKQTRKIKNFSLV